MVQETPMQYGYAHTLPPEQQSVLVWTVTDTPTLAFPPLADTNAHRPHS